MKVLAIAMLGCVALAQTRPGDVGIRRDEMVNLVAASLTANPETPLTGEQVHVSLSIVNRSENAASGVSVVLFAGKTRVAATTVNVPARQTTEVPLTWVPAAAGAMELTAIVDPDRRLVEEDHADNVISIPLAVGDAAQRNAAFAVSDLELVTQGDRTTIRARVQNSGTSATSGPVVFRIGDRVVAAQYVANLAPGASTLVEVPVTAPAGGIRISAQANPRFATAAPVMISKVTGLPTDLRVEGLSVNSAEFETSRARRVTIAFRIVNAGQNPITGPFRTRISPGLMKSGVPADDFFTTPKLAAGETVYLSRTLDSPPGDFDIRVEVDVDRSTADQDRTNNVATAHFHNPSPNQDRWVAIGPRRIDGEGNIGAVGALFHLAIDPRTPSTIYVGGNGEGIWKSVDAGQNWQPITDSLTTLSSTALALDPSNPLRLYLSTADQGVFKTEDGGGAWTPLDTPNFQPEVAALSVMRVHPANPNLLFLTTNKGVYTYHADGAPPKWTLPLSLAPATDLVFDPATPTTVYATLRAPATGIYISQDSGAHWVQQFGCPGGALPATDGVQSITLAFAGSTMYAAFKSNQKVEVYRTTATACFVGSQREQSWERSFSLTGNDANQLWNRIDGDPATPNVVYLSGTDFRVSRDGGKSFSVQSGTQPHADHHGFAADPSSPKNIYVVCDGGIYRSSNLANPNTWQFLGDGIFNVQFYAFSVAESDAALTTGGTQDNGTLAYTGSTVWNNINGGDGATTAIDPTNTQIQYSMNQGPDSMQKRVGSGSWKCIACGIPVSQSCFNLFFQLDTGAPTTVLASCQSLLKADSPVCNRCPDWTKNDTGDPNVWTTILPQSAVSGAVVRSAVDRTVNLYYAGTTAGQIWAGAGGANWQLLFTGTGAVSDIKIDRDDPTTFYVSMIGGLAGRVYRVKRMANAPTSATTLVTDITSNLPTGLAVKALAIDLMNPVTVFAGTNRGVYRCRSTDSGATWTWAPYMNGLPLADVREMDVQPMTGVLRAITFGRGAYEVSTGDPVGSLLSASGRVTFLRAHDVGTGFGPLTDFLDVEVVVQLDSQPGKSFGFQLRADNQEDAHNGMLDILRSALRANRTVLIDYFRTGIHNGRIIRVAKIN